MGMRVAALYDVHGNVRALEAVLREAGEVDAYVFGGDLVAGPWPRETLELARSLGGRARFIRGNWERAIVEEDGRTEHMRWLQEQLAGEDLDWPATLELDGVLYCHATPRSDSEIVLPEWGESDWSAFEGPLVVCGHTHVQFDVERNGTRIVNPGSVGNPTLRATAWWAMVDGDEVELRTTDYDTMATAAEMRTSGFPRGDFADELLEPYTLDRIVELLESFGWTGLLGGTFDPPHSGHVALAAGAKRAFDLPQLTVLVAAEPGHKRAHAAAADRLELARAAFPDDTVTLDRFPRTIDRLRAERYLSPLFVMGADEFESFLSWKEPEAILELAELAVGSRPGYPRERLDVVLAQLGRPERVHFFELEPDPASSTEIRAHGRLERVPPAVAELIRERGLYRPRGAARLDESRPEDVPT